MRRSVDAQADRRRRRRRLRPGRGGRASPRRPRRPRVRGGRLPRRPHEHDRRGDGRSAAAVDTGFIVFNERNYPNFERMLAELGVASQPTNMSFSVSDGRGGFEWATTGPRGLFARPAHALDPRFHRMLRDLVRFNREARKLVGSARQGPVAAPLPRRRRLLRVLRRAAARPAGLGGVVRRPGPDVELPRRLPRRVLRQPPRAAAPRPALMAHGHRRLAPLRRGADRAVSRPCPPPHPGAPHPAPAGWGGHRLDDSSERFDEVVLAVHSDRRAADARRPEPPPRRRSSARSPTSETRPSCTPTRA